MMIQKCSCGNDFTRSFGSPKHGWHSYCDACLEKIAATYWTEQEGKNDPKELIKIMLDYMMACEWETEKKKTAEQLDEGFLGYLNGYIAACSTLRTALHRFLKKDQS